MNQSRHFSNTVLTGEGQRGWFRIFIASVFVAVLAGIFYLWLVMLSPFGYKPPEGMPAIDPEREYRVFVYGTLRLPVVRWLVMGGTASPTDAVLPHYRKEGLDLVPEPGASTRGLVLQVDAKELGRLDRYERMGVRYDRIELELRDSTRAWVYVRLENP